MFNFGKFVRSAETVMVQGEAVRAIFARGKAGDDLVDVLKANPHPFYIAVDEAGRIVSMESDPEKIQITEMEIIGIDSDYGFTRGRDGTVYGAVWDGKAIVAPPVPIPTLTSRQFWQAALEIGVSEEGLAASIADPDDPLYIADEAERAAVLIDIRKATSFRRDYPLLVALAAAHDLPEEQLDQLWMWAAQF